MNSFGKGGNQLQEHISKDKLTEIIDGLHLQMVWVWLAIDSLDAIKTIDKVKIKRAQNFMYITHSSLIYRYSMELAKLFDQKDGLSIYQIRNMCLQNKRYFDAAFDIAEYCKNFKKALGQYKSLIKNITERRRKTYAHNDKDYYLFNQKAVNAIHDLCEAVKQLDDHHQQIAFSACLAEMAREFNW